MNSPEAEEAVGSILGTLAVCIVAGGMGLYLKYPVHASSGNPIAFQITIKTEGKVAGIVMPRNGGAICQKGLEDLPIVTTVNELSEQDSFQHMESSSGFLDQKTLSTNTSPEGLYTFIKDSTGKVILRLINRDGNGIKKLYNQQEVAKATQQSCS